MLYSITLLPEKFEVSVHIHSASACTTKSVYTAINPNLTWLNGAFNALYSYIDDSTHFLICQSCKQLLAAELCSDDTCGGTLVKVSSNEQSAHQHCKTTYKQAFDTCLVDRISCTHGVVKVFKDEDYIKFYTSSTAWPHPHEPEPYDRVIETLPLTATPDEVNALRLKLTGEQKYPAPCFHCEDECEEGDAMDLDSFVDFDTDAIVCYGCASMHYGVVY